MPAQMLCSHFLQSHFVPVTCWQSETLMEEEPASLATIKGRWEEEYLPILHSKGDCEQVLCNCSCS